MSTVRHLALLVLISAGCGVTTPPLRIEHDAALDFGAIAASEFSTRELSVRNPGDAPVTVAVSLDAGPFTVTKASLVIDRRASASLQVTFAPSSLGPATRVLHFAVGDATSDVTLSGSGTGPQASAPEVVSFGQVPLVPGRPDVTHRTLTVRNTGTSGSVLHLAVPTVDGDEICVGEWGGGACTPWTPVPLEAGASVDIPLSLTPHTTGAREWHLAFLSDDPLALRHEVTLLAVVEPAAPCDLELQPSPVLELRGGAGLVTARHRGPGRCFLRAVDFTSVPDGVFSLLSPLALPLPLGPNESMDLWVRSSPLAPASSIGTLHVRSAGGDDFQVGLRLEAVPCLVASPSDLDFGLVGRGCNSTSRVVALYNVCSRAIEVTAVNVLAAAGQPPGGPDCPGATPCPEFFQTSSPAFPARMEPGGAPLFVSLKYLPLDYGPDTGALRIESSDGDTVVALRGQGDARSRMVDTWRVDPLWKSDLLVLVDASPSFVPKRAAVRSNLEAWLHYLSFQCLDTHLAFAAAEGAPDGGRALLTNDAGVAWFSSRDGGFVDDALSAFDSLPVGSETEACLGPALDLVRAPDAGARRDAFFAGLCITDALEQTPDAGGAWSDLRGFGLDGGFVGWPSWSAVTGLESSTCAVEALDDGTHRALVNLGNGVREDICDPTWWYGFQWGVSDGCGFRTTYFLTVRPASVAALVIKVDGVVLPATNAQGEVAWSYDSTTNAIHFEPLYAPPPGSTVEASYDERCTP